VTPERWSWRSGITSVIFMNVLLAFPHPAYAIEPFHNPEDENSQPAGGVLVVLQISPHDLGLLANPRFKLLEIDFVPEDSPMPTSVPTWPSRIAISEKTNLGIAAGSAVLIAAALLIAAFQEEEHTEVT